MSATACMQGYVPHYEDIDWTGSDVTAETLYSVMSVDPEEWKQEILSKFWRVPEKWELAHE